MRDIKKKFGRLVIRFDLSPDHCPRLGAWFAWDSIVVIGLVFNLGMKRFGVWLLRNA